MSPRQAHPKITAETVAAMTRSLSQMEDAARRGDTRAYWEHHLDFHELFINASGNEILIHLLKNLRMHSLWHRFAYRYYQEDLQKAVAVHRTILGLLKNPAADAAEIEKIVRGHIDVALEKFMNYLETPDKL